VSFHSRRLRRPETGFIYRVNTGDPLTAVQWRSVKTMNNEILIRDFLATRRARITPRQAGLPDYGGRRRVPGLRREEVALLAGMSTEYYVRLERGNAKGVSDAVLEGICRALQLDEAERTHLHDLVRAANAGPRTTRKRLPAKSQRVRPGVQQLLDAMTGVPAIVQNGRLDIIASNALGRALFSELFDQDGKTTNFARFLFLAPRAKEIYQDWEDAAQQIVAMLRIEAGRVSYDRALSDLIGELSTRSDDFRILWASHDVRLHSTGTKRIHHPVVGRLELDFEALPLSAESGLMFLAYTAKPGSASHDGLQLLATWAATQQQTHPNASELPDVH
jgi:transcriptional regulator with XRE-family HTH domain